MLKAYAEDLMKDALSDAGLSDVPIIAKGRLSGAVITVEIQMRGFYRVAWLNEKHDEDEHRKRAKAAVEGLIAAIRRAYHD